MIPDVVSKKAKNKITCFKNNLILKSKQRLSKVETSNTSLTKVKKFAIETPSQIKKKYNTSY